jgi:hypothetical protein
MNFNSLPFPAIPVFVAPGVEASPGTTLDENGQISAVDVLNWKFGGKAKFNIDEASGEINWLNKEEPAPTDEDINQWRAEYINILIEKSGINQEDWKEFRNKLWGYNNQSLVAKFLQTSNNNALTLLLASFNEPDKGTLDAFCMAFRFVRTGLRVDFSQEELDYIIQSAKESGINISSEKLAPSMEG